MTPTELKEARQKLGLSQSQLAEELGVEGDSRAVPTFRWEAEVEDDGYGWYGHARYWRPTHWMPLPEPPQ